MDPVVLGALIGAGAGTLFGWAMIFAYYMIGQRVAKGKERVVREARVDDSEWQPMFGRPVSDWKRVFAWKPVHTIDEGWIWLKFYWRRRIHKKQFLHGGDDFDDFWFQNVVTLRYIGV